MVQAPIFHVNGDDPEACGARHPARVRVPAGVPARTSSSTWSATGATATTRATSRRSPSRACTSSSTSTPSVRKLYTELLVQPRRPHARRGEQALERLPRPARRTRSRRRTPTRRARRRGAGPRRRRATPRRPRRRRRPACRARPCSTASSTRSTHVPDGFECTRSSSASCRRRRTEFDGDEIDWALAEALAFGSLAARGHAGARSPARTPGAARSASATACSSTSDTEAEYVPLAHLADDAGAVHALRLGALRVRGARLRVRLLGRRPRRARRAGKRSSATSPTARRSIIDQFIVAADDKWGQQQRPRAAAPPRLRGPGPRALERAHRALPHAVRRRTTCASSTRPRRRSTSTCCAARRTSPRAMPLVCFTPKRYLRMPQTRSPVAELTDGGFHVVLDDRAAPDATPSTRVLLCTGKIGHELHGPSATQRGAPAAVVRVEQLYPWPEAELVAAARPLPRRHAGVVGAGGAGEHGRLELRPRPPAPRAARPGRAPARGPARRAPSPASGSSKVHDAEQQRLLAAAFAKL